MIDQIDLVMVSAMMQPDDEIRELGAQSAVFFQAPGVIVMRYAHCTILLFLGLASHAMADIYRYQLADNLDDGNEVMDALWYESGFGIVENNGVIYVGHADATSYDAAMRYTCCDVIASCDIIYARIVFPSFGGQLAEPLVLAITGIALSEIEPFTQANRPSQLPRTQASISWIIPGEWDSGSDSMPLYYPSPDIAPIIRELLDSRDTGCVDIGIAIDCVSTNSGASYCRYEDSGQCGIIDEYSCAVLELYTTLKDTFVCPGLLGRPTDHSAVLNIESLVDLDAYVEYGASPGCYEHRTAEHLNLPGGRAFEITIDNLTPDTEYYYRVAYRRAGGATYEYASENAFHTQRGRGRPFVFVVEADEHLGESMSLPMNSRKQDLYAVALNNIRASDPDLFISLGDYATLKNADRDIVNYQEARDYYALQRAYTDHVASSAFFYLVMGNHEAECGWYYDHNAAGNNDTIAIWGARARLEYIPNPIPDGFYTGGETTIPEYGSREDYYAWEWGDALFIVLSPYWYTEEQPRIVCDNWAWTLGAAQYEWLYRTLRDTRSGWIFVFIHQLVSSNENPNMPGAAYYGRGGIEIAKYKVDGRPSYEWGGEDAAGNDVYSQHRPGWNHGPIHDMFVLAGVDIVFHGHDHVYAKQDLDGIVYLECPALADPAYLFGFRDSAQYEQGVILANSGHIEVAVARNRVGVKYVRAYLPGDGENGAVAHEFTLEKPNILTPTTIQRSHEARLDRMP